MDANLDEMMEKLLKDSCTPTMTEINEVLEKAKPTTKTTGEKTMKTTTTTKEETMKTTGAEAMGTKVIETVGDMEVRAGGKAKAGKKAELPEIVKKIMRYGFKKHILIEGEKGSGKTYSISKFLDQEGIDTVFLAGHEGMESIDLLGYLIPDKSGDLVWKDGALTEAFRRAQYRPVVMFFDELLRVPSRELNLLVGSLSPNSRGEYVLRTGRVLEVVDGIAIEETLVVPSQNLWVIGTTNVGAGYAVDEIDEALSDRFRIVRKDTSKTEMTKIIKALFPKGSPNYTKELMKVYSYVSELRKKGDLNKIVNMRHLVEAVQISDFSKEGIVANLVDLIPHWIDRDTDGYLNKVQQDLVMKSIQQAFDL